MVRSFKCSASFARAGAALLDGARFVSLDEYVGVGAFINESVVIGTYMISS